MAGPEFMKPSVGDALILATPRTRWKDGNRSVTWETVPVVVHKVARFKVTLRPEDWDGESWELTAYDLRTRGPWGEAPYRNGSSELHTEGTWAYAQRLRKADVYLRESGLFTPRGSLDKAVREDRLGFANALRRFEGLDEI